MAISAPRPSHSRGGGGLVAGLWVLLGVCCCSSCSSWLGCFVGTTAAPSQRHAVLRGARLIVGLRAEGESVALVKVTEENKVTTASVLGGLAGLLVGGVWVGAGLFAAGAYLARKGGEGDDDVSKALKGVAAGSIEALNFGAYLNDKYTVTDRLGGAISDAIGSAKKSSSGETAAAASGFVDGVVDTIKAADREVDFKTTFGTLAASASDLAYQAVDKAVELNGQYKISDQIAEKLSETASNAQAQASSSKVAASSSN